MANHFSLGAIYMTQQEILSKLETDIRLRGMSDETLKEYTGKAKVFMRHFGKPADELGEKEIRAFLEYLDREKHLSPASINTYNSGLRFLFEVTLERDLNYKRVPRKKDPIKLPVAFTREEVLRFLSVIDDDLRYKSLFTVIYGSGLRLSEAQKLRIQDIDSKQMRLFVNQGKGKRDRWVPLAYSSLLLLREYYKTYKPSHPDSYLFLYGKFGNGGNEHISTRAIQDAFKKYHLRAQINTYGTTHTLRHSYATHLLEDGVNVFFIQKILGHATLWTTMRYLRISQTDVMKTVSPLDKIMGTIMTDNA